MNRVRPRDTVSVPPYARALEGERFSKLSHSIWPPELNLQDSFKSVVTCEYSALRSPSYAERNTSLSNKHFLQGKRDTIKCPYLAGSLSIQNPVVSRHRDCPLGLRLPPDIKR